MIDTISAVTCSCGHMSISADTKTSKTLHQEHAAGRLGHFYGPPTPLSNPCTNFDKVRAVARQEAEERRALHSDGFCFANSCNRLISLGRASSLRFALVLIQLD